MGTENGNPGISRLAKVISRRSKAFVEGSYEQVLDFGTIQSDWSLLTNTFPCGIPKGDYFVLRHASGATVRSGSTNEHTHSVKLPTLKKGDHVLVAWTGNTPVVLDVIIPSNKL